MIYIIIVSILIAVICFGVQTDTEVNDSPDLVRVLTIMGIGAFIIGIVALADILTPVTPEAIDVYRGNTTLQIINKTENGIVVDRDSIVVFKSAN